MRKRILGILLSVFTVLTLLPTVALASPVSYGIWVGSTEVTSDNAGNVTGDGIDGIVTYDANSNTLTLNGATITKTYDYLNAAISSFQGESRDLNINLVGSNTITISSGAISAKGVAGIYARNVSIKGTAGSSLSVSIPFSSEQYNICIYGAKGVAIEDCTVTATTGNSTGISGSLNNPCIGINASSGSLSIKNATVTANAGNTKQFSRGIQVYNGSLSIENSTVTANGGNGEYGSYGISASYAPSTTISASTVTATGNTSALYFTNLSGVFVAPTASGHTATASADKSDAGAVSVNVTDTSVYGVGNTYKFVHITPASLSQPVIGTLAISDSISFIAGHNYTVSDLDSYKPTITPNEATITAEGWQQYNPNGGGYWEPLSSSGITPDTGSAFTLRYYANYSGGTVYSNTVTLNVVGNTTSLALTATPASPQDTGTPITLTATLTGFFAPAGLSERKIIFKNGTETLGEASLSAGGAAVYMWLPSTAGSYSLTATYAGTAYNTAATSNTVSYTVNVALPTAAVYAADAASDTDYVLDGTNKTLTINTAKGAAFWSANGASYLDYTVLLAKDVDVSGFSWTRVGDPGAPFTGSFDGQGHSITGLTASAPYFSGLFGRVNGATIKNLCLSGSVQISNDSGSDSYGGALVAYAVASTITNCCSHADITATSSGEARTAYAGGLVGITDARTLITNCFNTGSISATASGSNDKTRTAYAGGIVGNSYNSDVINCYSVGSVTASASNDSYAGGVVGYIGAGAVENCYYLSSAANNGIGGMMNGNSATISGCGTIGGDKTTLTAGTAVQFEAEQTLASYADTLLNALNGWVNDKASADYNTWHADSAGSPVNGGYPVLNSAWGSLNLTGVGCNVAAGTITGTTANMQYSLDGGGTWQDCAAGNTTGLTFAAGTVKVRQKDKTANEHTVITIAAPVAANAPTLGSKTYNSVTLTAMPGYEYSKDGGATWQNSNLFSSLSSSTAYSFVTRIKATATALPGTVSSALNITTNEAPSGNDGSNGGGSDTQPAASTIYNYPSQPKATIWLSGSELSQGELLLTPALTKGGDYNAFLKLADEADIVRIYDVSVKSGKKPVGKDMSLTFDLGTQYAGQSFTLVHKKADGTFEYFFATANARGLVSFGPLTELSPFMLVKGKISYTPLREIVEVPQTGDSTSSIGFAFLSLSIMLSALWLMHQNKSKRT